MLLAVSFLAVSLIFGATAPTPTVTPNVPPTPAPTLAPTAALMPTVEPSPVVPAAPTVGLPPTPTAAPTRSAVTQPALGLPASLLPPTIPGLSSNEGTFVVTAADDGSRAVYFVAGNARHSVLQADLQLEMQLNPLWPLRQASRDEVLAIVEGSPVGSARAGLLSGPPPSASDATVETPAIDQPIAQQPAVEQPIATQPAAEPPAATQPVVDQTSAAQPAATQPVIAQPAAEQPVDQPVAQPAATQPSANPPVIGQPAAEQPAATQPVAEPPVIAQPAAEQPLAAQPAAVAQPAVAQLLAPQPSAAQPTEAKPTVYQPLGTQPLLDSPTDQTAYVLRPGDNLTRIAERYNTSIQAILAANNVTNANVIYVGKSLVIPTASAPATAVEEPATAVEEAAPVADVAQQAPVTDDAQQAPVVEAPQPPPSTTYTVRAGDSAIGIARQFGVELDALLAANRVGDRNRVFVGQVLTIPSSES